MISFDSTLLYANLNDLGVNFDPHALSWSCLWQSRQIAGFWPSFQLFTSKHFLMSMTIHHINWVLPSNLLLKKKVIMVDGHCLKKDGGTDLFVYCILFVNYRWNKLYRFHPDYNNKTLPSHNVIKNLSYNKSMKFCENNIIFPSITMKVYPNKHSLVGVNN